MAKDKYEISIWQDRYNSDLNKYEEEKIAVIGSDSMTASCRAYEPKLVENINGSNTFTFKMHYKYKDPYDDTLKDNPFLNLLVNERKIKVKWKDRWYDLIIKNCREESSGKSIVYTCTDLFLNELAKTGYNLEFDNELENNQGNISELAQVVLDGTDWKLGDCDLIQQTKDEPVYVLRTVNSFAAYNETTGATTTTTIPSNARVLIFYSIFEEKATHAQFLYDSTDEYPRDTNSQLVIDVPCFGVDVTWDGNTAKVGNTVIFNFGETPKVSTEYRGSRLVRSQQCKLDPLTKKYSYIYQANTSAADGSYDEGDIIYEYRTTDCKDPTIVNNLVVNSKDFKDVTGWSGSDDLVWTLYPEYPATGTSADKEAWVAKSYLKIKGATSGDAVKIYNGALQESGVYFPDGIQRGDRFVFRAKVMGNNDNKPDGTYVTDSQSATGRGFTPIISTYTIDSHGKKIPDQDDDTDYATRQFERCTANWLEWEIEIKKSFSKLEARTNNIGLFLKAYNGQTRWIEEVQFFPIVYGATTMDDYDATKTYIPGERCTNGNVWYECITQTTGTFESDDWASIEAWRNGDEFRINPGEMETQSLVKPIHKYYNYTQNTAKDPEEIHYLHVGDEWSNTDIDPVYVENFEKIRSITVKNSNRFNILQEIAKTFECWCRFNIKHNEDGTIKVDGQGRLEKNVDFVKQVGQETGIGFIYGIDLKGITRTVQSDQIVTKTIVNPNSNEFAQNGFCTIQRSTENYARDSFILNFDYYIAHGLINADNLNDDLYDMNTGYLYNLRLKNIAYDSKTEWLTQKKTEFIKQESYRDTYQGYITAASDENQNIKNYIIGAAKADSWADAQDYVTKNIDRVDTRDRLSTIQNNENTIKEYSVMLNRLKKSIAILEEQIEDAEEEQKGLVDDIKLLHANFFKKYGRFIQEGFWIDEKYYDDNLYYLDAQSVAYTSSRPKVSYEISVIRVSAVEGFENKVFRMGDISYVQDTEFFGYTDVNGVKTPIREKVLVSEITSNFDEPEKDVFKVQNYKTQFEDLFQRIVASTQALQYTAGEYARAANGFSTNGTIEADVFQDSLDKNAQLVISAQNDVILQDNTGITVTDGGDPRKKTRITSGGIFITTDGGQNWKNAIRGDGVSTQYLAAGQIDTTKINLYDGNNATFRWDSNGITAFATKDDPQSGEGAVLLSKFVRLDHYGIYGLDFSDQEDPNHPYDQNYDPDERATALGLASGEDAIWEDAQFGLTWHGFFLKSKHDSHRIEISTDNDIRIVATPTDGNGIEVPRIKIGLLTEEGDEVENYGFALYDENGDANLIADSTGELWLNHILHVNTSSDEDFDAKFGYFGKRESWNEKPDLAQTINICDQFIVWEDGSVKTIAGEIGGIPVDKLETTISNAGTQYYPVINGSEVRANSTQEVLAVSSDFITVSNGLLFFNGSVTFSVRVGNNNNDNNLEPATVTFYYKIGNEIKTDVQPTQTIAVDGIYTIPLSYLWSSPSGMESTFNVYVVPNHCRISIKNSGLMGALFGRGLALEDAVKRMRHDFVGFIDIGDSSIEIFGVNDVFNPATDIELI